MIHKSREVSGYDQPVIVTVKGLVSRGDENDLPIGVNLEDLFPKPKVTDNYDSDSKQRARRKGGWLGTPDPEYAALVNQIQSTFQERASGEIFDSSTQATTASQPHPVHVSLE